MEKKLTTNDDGTISMDIDNTKFNEKYIRPIVMHHQAVDKINKLKDIDEKLEVMKEFNSWVDIHNGKEINTLS
jgi:hypothetical protein